MRIETKLKKVFGEEHAKFLLEEFVNPFVKALIGEWKALCEMYGKEPNMNMETKKKLFQIIVEEFGTKEG